MEVWRDEGREGGWGEWVLPHSLLWLFAEACNPVRVEATFFARAKKMMVRKGGKEAWKTNLFSIFVRMRK